jgi:hypothetical protein
MSKPKGLEKSIDFIIEQMKSSLYDEEGTIDCIIGEGLKEIENLIDCSVSDFEWQAYTMNIINQCMNFIKSFKKNGGKNE